MVRHLIKRFPVFFSAPPPFLGSTRSLQSLAYEEIRSSPDVPVTSTAFVLHGLLGTGRNWRSFARDLASHLRTMSSSHSGIHQDSSSITVV